MDFNGQYTHQMDDKGRLSLPSAFRREAEEFVLLQWEKPYLTLFPMEQWASIQSELRTLRKNNPEAANYVRRISAGAHTVSPDKQGRILIPARLQTDAGLEGEVLLVGVIDRVELWSPALFESQVADAGDDEATAKFTHRIFG